MNLFRGHKNKAYRRKLRGDAGNAGPVVALVSHRLAALRVGAVLRCLLVNVAPHPEVELRGPHVAVATPLPVVGRGAHTIALLEFLEITGVARGWMGVGVGWSSRPQGLDLPLLLFMAGGGRERRKGIRGRGEDFLAMIVVEVGWLLENWGKVTILSFLLRFRRTGDGSCSSHIQSEPTVDYVHTLHFSNTIIVTIFLCKGNVQEHHKSQYQAPHLRNCSR